MKQAILAVTFLFLVLFAIFLFIGMPNAHADGFRGHHGYIGLPLAIGVVATAEIIASNSIFIQNGEYPVVVEMPYPLYSKYYPQYNPNPRYYQREYYGNSYENRQYHRT